MWPINLDLKAAEEFGYNIIKFCSRLVTKWGTRSQNVSRACFCALLASPISQCSHRLFKVAFELYVLQDIYQKFDFQCVGCMLQDYLTNSYKTEKTFSSQGLNRSNNHPMTDRYMTNCTTTDHSTTALRPKQADKHFTRDHLVVA